MGVAIIGRMKMPRARPRSGNLLWKTIAAAMPMITGTITASAV